MLHHQPGRLPLGQHASSPQAERSYWRCDRYWRAQVIEMVQESVRQFSSSVVTAATDSAAEAECSD
jgi:hypothetical protein